MSMQVKNTRSLQTIGQGFQSFQSFLARLIQERVNDTRSGRLGVTPEGMFWQQFHVHQS